MMLTLIFWGALVVPVQWLGIIDIRYYDSCSKQNNHPLVLKNRFSIY